MNEEGVGGGQERDINSETDRQGDKHRRGRERERVESGGEIERQKDKRDRDR